jgi:periplasmic protein TonB
MEISTILTADVLDIIFDGRNKEYGAYELRRSYKRRLVISMTVMLSVMLLLCIGFAFAGKRTLAGTEVIILPDDPHLAAIDPEKKKILILPPPQKAAPHVQTKTLKDLTVRIVKDNEVRDDEKPPVNKDLEHVQIGNITKGGVEDNGEFVGPPGDNNTGKGIIELPKKDDEDDDYIFRKVEIESDYPGGAAAWQRFLNRNFRYPQEAVESGIQGIVTVQFIVDKDGSVSNVEAISGPPELRAEAVRVIKKSGKWTPAIQNGRQVKSYKKQPIVFRLETEG